MDDTDSYAWSVMEAEHSETEYCHAADGVDSGGDSAMSSAAASCAATGGGTGSGGTPSDLRTAAQKRKTGRRRQWRHSLGALREMERANGGVPRTRGSGMHSGTASVS